jgi:ABC-2 type transport system ATP-binding protein
MRRRLNVACGVLHRPEVVLLDEPTVGVDPQSRERIQEMLRELHGEGASLLHTTHQLEEAQVLAERIVILDHGRNVASGTFDELLEATIGRERRIRVRLGDGEELTESTTDVAVTLRRILEDLAADDREIADLRIEAPNLQAVFLHLTGRELRE